MASTRWLPVGTQRDPLEQVLEPASAAVGTGEVEDPLDVGAQPGREELAVPGDGVAGRTVEDQSPAVEQQRALAEVLQGHEVVADVEDGPPLVAGHRLHLRHALALEPGVAHRQDLVDDQDVGVEVGGHREREPHPHPVAVALHRCVEEAVDLGERDDLVEAAGHLGGTHPEDRAAEVDVLEPGELGVEPGADLEEGADAPDQVDVPVAGRGDPTEDLEQRALARAVAADDAHRFTALHVEPDVVEGEEGLSGLGPAPDRVADPALQDLEEGSRRPLSPSS